MSVWVKILPERGIAYVHFAGFVIVDDSLNAFRAYMAHPDCRPGQKHLVNMADVTGLENNVPRVLQLQALMAEHFVGQPVQTMMAYIAPNPVARSMAALVHRSWDGNDDVVLRIMSSEAEALAFLGLPEKRLADLLEGQH